MSHFRRLEELQSANEVWRNAHTKCALHVWRSTSNHHRRDRPLVASQSQRTPSIHACSRFLNGEVVGAWPDGETRGRERDAAPRPRARSAPTCRRLPNAWPVQRTGRTVPAACWVQTFPFGALIRDLNLVRRTLFRFWCRIRFDVHLKATLTIWSGQWCFCQVRKFYQAGMRL